MLTLSLLLIIVFVNCDIGDCGDKDIYCVILGDLPCEDGDECYDNIASVLEKIEDEEPSEGHNGGKRIILVGDEDGTETFLNESVIIDGISPNNSVSDTIEVYEGHTVVWYCSFDYVLTMIGGSKDWIIGGGEDGTLELRSDIFGPYEGFFNIEYDGEGDLTFGPFSILEDSGSLARIAWVSYTTDVIEGSVTFTDLVVDASGLFTEQLFYVEQAVGDQNRDSSESFVIQDSVFEDSIDTYLVHVEQPNFVVRRNYITGDTVEGIIYMYCEEGQIGGLIENNLIVISVLADTIFVSDIDGTIDPLLNQPLYISNNGFSLVDADGLITIDSEEEVNVTLEIRNNLVYTDECIPIAIATASALCNGDFSYNMVDVSDNDCGLAIMNDSSCELDFSGTFEGEIPWMGRDDDVDEPFPFYRLNEDIEGTSDGEIPNDDLKGMIRRSTVSMGPYERLCDGLCGLLDDLGTCIGEDECECEGGVDAGSNCQCIVDDYEEANDNDECVCMGDFKLDTNGDCSCDTDEHWVQEGDRCVCDSAANWVKDGDICICDIDFDFNEDNGNCEEKSSGLSAAAIAGIAIGCVVGCAACCAVIIVICFIMAVILIEVIKQLRHSKHLSLGLFSGGGGDKGDGTSLNDDDEEHSVKNEVDVDDDLSDDSDDDDKNDDDDSGNGDTSDDDSD